jgi:hypothetical protein
MPCGDRAAHAGRALLDLSLRQTHVQRVTTERIHLRRFQHHGCCLYTGS